MSWKNVGFFSFISNEEVEKIQLEHDFVLNKPTLKNKSTHNINEKERGKNREFKYDFLNEHQVLYKMLDFVLCVKVKYQIKIY